MNTVDLSGITVEDLEKAASTLNSDAKQIYARVNIVEDLVIRYPTSATCDPWFLKILISVSNLPTAFHIFLKHRDLEHHAQARFDIIDSYAPLNSIPTNISDLPRKNDFVDISASIPEIQKMYEYFINAFRAASKEDFYDDASDYQDDEPSDFGDASNYDENLVRRIRKVIE